jgi:hypothetical protein
MEWELAEGLRAFQVERDVACRRLVVLLPGDLLDHGPHVDRLAPHTRHARQGEIIRHHTVHAGQLDFDGGKGCRDLAAGVQVFLQHLELQGQALQRIADFMGHRGRQLPQDDQELGTPCGRLLLGAGGGIPEQTDHKQLILQHERAETHLDGEGLAIFAASRDREPCDQGRHAGGASGRAIRYAIRY